jgi:nicotinamide-nucleotide amidase
VTDERMEPTRTGSDESVGAARLVARLREGGRTVACAESLTGGLLSATVVDVPGASNVLLGGIVAYATELKRALVGVDERLLDERGPVDPEVAEQLAERIRALCAVGGRAADLGLATTGVAGPDPQGGHPPGLVYVGVASARGTRAVELRADGDRSAVRRAAVARALAEAWAELDALDAASVSD